MKTIKNMRFKRKNLFILSVALMVMGCTAIEQKKPQEQMPLRVNIQVVTPQAHSTGTRYVGTIAAATETPLSLQTTGRVLSVHVKDGDRVRKGQVLVRIDSTQALNAYQSAEAAWIHAKDGYDRVKSVHAKGVVADQKMVEIQSQMQQALSLYEAAKQQLRECTLTTPCDGIINGLDVRVGQTVIPGTRVLSIVDLSTFSVLFTVPEEEVNTIYVGQKGEIDCAATQTRYPVTVTEKSLKANSVSHTYKITARIHSNDSRIMPGMIGKVELQQNSTDMQIIIPARCILLMPDNATVWVKEQGIAQRRKVTIGSYQADGVLVTEGLQPGDSLIIDGYQKLFKGALIEGI